MGVRGPYPSGGARRNEAATRSPSTFRVASAASGNKSTARRQSSSLIVAASRGASMRIERSLPINRPAGPLDQARSAAGASWRRRRERCHANEGDRQAHNLKGVGRILHCDPVLLVGASPYFPTIATLVFASVQSFNTLQISHSL